MPPGWGISCYLSAYVSFVGTAAIPLLPLTPAPAPPTRDNLASPWYSRSWRTAAPPSSIPPPASAPLPACSLQLYHLACLIQAGWTLMPFSPFYLLPVSAVVWHAWPHSTHTNCVRGMATCGVACRAYLSFTTPQLPTTATTYPALPSRLRRPGLYSPNH